MARQKFDYDLIVIGSGAAGSVAAHIVARAGKRVAIIEYENVMGGESLNWGCVPTKALLHAASVYDTASSAAPLGIRSGTVGYNYPSIKSWKDSVVQRTGAGDGRRYHQADGIDVIEGRAHFIDPHTVTVNRRHLSGAHFLIATGSSWNIPRGIEGLADADYITAREAVDLIRPPKTAFIIGAGAVGCEFAYLFSVFGGKVYLADVESRILAKEDEEASDLASRLLSHENRGVRILTSTKVLRVEKEGFMKRVTFERGGVEQSVKVEAVLVAAGKVPNTDIGLENAGIDYSPSKGICVTPQLVSTSAKHVFGAGDVTGGYMFTHVATYESRIVAHNLLHRDKLTADYSAIPRVTFLEPEVASVGLSEADCLRRDLRIKKAVVPIASIARSNTSNSRDGFVKVIADSKGTVIGATIVAPRAGEMIHELTLAVQYKMPASAVAAAIHAFPTWSEAVRAACSRI